MVQLGTMRSAPSAPRKPWVDKLRDLLADDAVANIRSRVAAVAQNVGLAAESPKVMLPAIDLHGDDRMPGRASALETIGLGHWHAPTFCAPFGDQHHGFVIAQAAGSEWLCHRDLTMKNASAGG